MVKIGCLKDAFTVAIVSQKCADEWILWHSQVVEEEKKTCPNLTEHLQSN